ncbi:hypothetical protein H5A44_01915 [Pectobacterium brasiliense]|uniref:IS1-like element transposase n=1 Tax=Pectobacterium brasiliense TaxID=180957 RepID=UPI001969C21A|nr:IS1-like element transposase [Pectobacterium brasiliense]MBN3341189.1 hypothetical protein [Pectobacterium brasiliense]
MTVNIEVSCRYCKQTEPVRKHGIGKTGFPQHYCQHCRRTLQINYRYNANKPGTKEKIVDMVMNDSGVRDTGRVLKISRNTVMSTLKNSHGDK